MRACGCARACVRVCVWFTVARVKLVNNHGPSLQSIGHCRQDTYAVQQETQSSAAFLAGTLAELHSYLQSCIVNYKLTE